MLEIGKKYRIPKKALGTENISIIDGMVNYYYETHVDGYSKFNFRRGINSFKVVRDCNGNERMPVIILDSSPLNNTSNYNPWHDELNPERGIIKYFGDNKPNAKEKDINNPLLLEQERINNSDKSIRLLNSIPILCFSKPETGVRIFQGFGVVEKAELVTQYSSKYNTYFQNYLFSICIFNIAKENEKFNWQWINDRCNPNLTIEQTMKNAPDSWKKWIDNGTQKIHLIRRNVYANKVLNTKDQTPGADTNTMKVLNSIYRYYDHKKHEFEYLAMEVTKKVIEENGASCTPGWITKRSGDGGIDFVLKLNVGIENLSGIQIVVLGQAKCEKPCGKANGVDIARTVARLKRGWIGSFVTTQSFSENVQKEVLEDDYPLMLINGKKVAEIVIGEFNKSDYNNLYDYLDSVSNSYECLNKKPEDILQ